MRCVCNIDGNGKGTICAAHQNGIDAAVAAEREACAKIADARWNPDNVTMTACAASIAAEIRSRQFDSK